MFNMTMAGRVSYGVGVSAQVGERVRALGAERVVVVTDENMERLGTADRICAHLEAAGVDSCVFAGVEPEPSVETTDAVAELAREHDCQAVIGLGGGSCMDVAKAVSVLITNEGSAGAYQGLGLVKVPGVPKIMIPTTAGTGSEVTCTAVLIRKADGFKGSINDDKLYPDTSFLDPELTLSMPPSVTASTGMDALVHAMEAYTSVNATSLSDMYAEQAMKLLFPNIRTAYADGRNLAARSAMMEGSMLAGKAFAIAGTTATHAFAYPIGAEFPIPHGMANALMVVEVFQFNLVGNLLKFARIADLAGEAVDGLPLREAAQTLVASLRELVADLALPTHLRDFGVKKSDLPRLAAGVLKVTRLLGNNPRRLGLEDAEAIYHRVL